MMNELDREAISTAIKNKDFDTFIYFYKKYNSIGITQGSFSEEFNCFCPIVYLPKEITVFDSETDKIIEEISVLDKDNFEKITFNECECG